MRVCVCWGGGVLDPKVYLVHYEPERSDCSQACHSTPTPLFPPPPLLPLNCLYVKKCVSIILFNKLYCIHIQLNACLYSTSQTLKT